MVQQFMQQAKEDKEDIINKGLEEKPYVSLDIETKQVADAQPYFEENPKRVDEHSRPIIDQTKNLDDRIKINNQMK